MSAVYTPVAQQREPGETTSREPVRVDRIVVGLLLAAVGTGWLLDVLGVSVPWHLFPAAALVLVGLALVGTIAGGRGRGALIALGAVLLVVATAVGVGVDRFAGPAGDRTLTPAAGEWPVETTLSAGNVIVDLTSNPLPQTGELRVNVGAGRVVVTVPRQPPVHVEARVVAGVVLVDGVKIDDGLDVHWSEANGAQVRVWIEVGSGEIEVRHD